MIRATIAADSVTSAIPNYGETKIGVPTFRKSVLVCKRSKCVQATATVFDVSHFGIGQHTLHSNNREFGMVWPYYGPRIWYLVGFEGRVFGQRIIENLASSNDCRIITGRLTIVCNRWSNLKWIICILRCDLPPTNPYVRSQASYFIVLRDISLVGGAAGRDDCYKESNLFKKSVVTFFSLIGAVVGIVGISIIFFGIDRRHSRNGWRLGAALIVSAILIVVGWLSQAIYPLPLAFYAEYAAVFLAPQQRAIIAPNVSGISR